MTQLHAYPGIKAVSMHTYLAGLGLARLTAEQRDENLCLSWRDDHLRLTLSPEEVSSFLLEQYTPTPIVSPWNNGSGYGAKDKAQRVALEHLVKNDHPRLRPYRESHSAARATLATPGASDWDKARLIQELRNRLPDQALPWLDAVTVLAVAPEMDKALFPPIGGTGGNDGRLEFSSNFHQRLADVIPELGAKREMSSAWLHDALHGTNTTRLVEGAIGQFDPVGAGGPGSHFLGSAKSLLNPWIYVLMMEGIPVFAASSARKLGEHGSRASIPFTVMYNEAGPKPGAAEESRGEIWVPLFDDPQPWEQVVQTFQQARVSWNGRTARSAAQMYAAMRSAGASRSVQRFNRLGILQRNGLAFTSVLLDTVQIDARPSISVAIPIEQRSSAFGIPGTTRLQGMKRRVERQMLHFTRDPMPDTLVEWLAAVTHLEMAVSTSTSARELTRASRRPPGSDVKRVIQPQLLELPEWRVALALASSHFGEVDEKGHRNVVPMSRAVLGKTPSPGDSGWDHPPVLGLGTANIVDLMAEVVLWQALKPSTAHLNVAMGVQPLAHQTFPCLAIDAHAWAGNLLDDNEIKRIFVGLVGLHWSPDIVGHHRSGACAAVHPWHSPALQLLAPFANGEVLRSNHSPDSARSVSRRGLDPTWLRSMATDSDATSAYEEASLWRRRCLIVDESGSAALQPAIAPLPLQSLHRLRQSNRRSTQLLQPHSIQRKHNSPDSPRRVLAALLLSPALTTRPSFPQQAS